MREDILHKAGDLFLEFGFKSVTMDHLARELGVSKKTIYEYFTNKSNLVEQVAYFIRDRIHAEIDLVQLKNLDPIEEMIEIKRVVMKRLKNEKTSPQFQFQRYYPKIYAKMRESQVCKMEDCIGKNIERGVDEGYYRKDIHKVFTCRIYIAGMLNLKDEELFKDSHLSPKELYEEFLKYHLRSIVDAKGLQRLIELEKHLLE
ncbi:TetR/AcrR family transcriptional regulator [Psychroflexus sp. YR1-1]|uniref:TetR/AcrR family transcriptional regulator n=1 Tax=Psychroflexus aurantiacus TaxID=2709310 RepID=A0A6B3R1T1_9FLAO|nr:TetR/AcrR family transcriptional regulator [Psychroflexus aurantiacus]NEV92585.1 TetR/AcrR family transcriptional regulator [Psychroflexus aurantiacus]